MSRYCDEFHLAPTAAVRELENDPNRLGLEIIELRAYANAWSHLKNLQEGQEAEVTTSVTWVFNVQRERKRRRRAEREGRK